MKQTRPAVDGMTGGGAMDLIWTVGLEDGETGLVERGVLLRAVVLYEDSVVGNRALAMLNSVARGVATPGRLVCSLWKFHFLEQPAFLEAAGADAQRADIVLIALPDAAELPLVVDRWMSSWLAGERRAPKALVAFSGGPSGAPGALPTMLSTLRDAARVGRMDFFVAGNGSLGEAALESALAQALAIHGRDAGRPFERRGWRDVRA